MPQEILDRIAVNRKEFEPISEALISKQDKTLALSMVTENMLKVGIAGDKSEKIKRLNPLVESGVDHVSFGPPLGPDPEKSLDILAKVKDYFSKNPTS